MEKKLFIVAVGAMLAMAVFGVVLITTSLNEQPIGGSPLKYVLSQAKRIGLSTPVGQFLHILYKQHLDSIIETELRKLEIQSVDKVIDTRQSSHSLNQQDKGEPLKEIKFSKVVGNTNLKDLQAGSHPIFGVGQRGITLESFRQKLFNLMADARHAESHSKVRRAASLEGQGSETPRLFPPTKHVGGDQVRLFY